MFVDQLNRFFAARLRRFFPGHLRRPNAGALLTRNPRRQIPGIDAKKGAEGTIRHLQRHCRAGVRLERSPPQIGAGDRTLRLAEELPKVPYAEKQEGSNHFEGESKHHAQQKIISLPGRRGMAFGFGKRSEDRGGKRQYLAWGLDGGFGRAGDTPSAGGEHPGRHLNPRSPGYRDHRTLSHRRTADLQAGMISF